MKTIVYDTVPSTMDVAFKHIMENSEESFVILAKEQTLGRGREENTWFSPKGGLYLSFVLPMKDSLAREAIAMFHYSTALAIVTCLKKLFDLKIKIKWPNDIHYEGKKLAGLLIEYISSKQDFMIVGIGINVNNRTEEFPDHIQRNAISLIDIIRKESNINRIVEELKNQILRNSSLTLNQKFQHIVNQFNQNCIQYMKTIVLKNNKKYNCEGINVAGRLILTSEKTKKELEIHESKDLVSYS
ncbi:MAG: biotin--[acetyl-CoA-carboxylase] ligase [Asgard group archaeon]|nr:biotin--[acetyl-CoA-carboxylase] ligase [Asgard group archaeon]